MDALCPGTSGLLCLMRFLAAKIKMFVEELG